MGTARPQLRRLLRRQDFLAAAKGRYCAMPGLVLQSRQRSDQDGPRIGFTATTKLGNAVTRNRIRRRLREAARKVMTESARPGHDYVVVGRQATVTREFADLQRDLETALKRVHHSAGAAARPGQR
jgi:ribonuclease P protein component